jgi:hypothetical protein
MRRTFAYLLICMPLCLFLVPDRAPVALSVPTQNADNYCDDGQTLPCDAVICRLAQEKPLEFLDICLKRYHREVKGYCGLLKKQERINGKLNPPESIDFCFREEPYSVLLKWREGARDVKASLYVDGENRNQAAVVTNTRIPISWNIDPEGKRARDAGRYSIREFSIRQGTERIVRAWQAAKDNGTLQVEYLGKLPVADLDGRICHVLKRHCNPPEDDGIATVEIAIDAENLMQIGSTLTGTKGELIGKYQFYNLKINPHYADAEFDRAALKK